MSEIAKQEQANTVDLDLMDKIFRVEETIKNMPGATHGIKETHHFSEGLYAREIFIPAGTILTGKIHKFENLNIISKGDISVNTESGIKRIKAPATIVSPPGTKRVGFAHEDTVWTTIHATKECDVEKIEQLFIAETFDDVALTENKKIELNGG